MSWKFGVSIFRNLITYVFAWLYSLENQDFIHLRSSCLPAQMLCFSKRCLVVYIISSAGVCYHIYQPAYPTINYRTTSFNIVNKPHCKTVFSATTSNPSIHSDIFQTVPSILP